MLPGMFNHWDPIFTRRAKCDSLSFLTAPFVVVFWSTPWPSATLNVKEKWLLSLPGHPFFSPYSSFLFPCPSHLLVCGPGEKIARGQTSNRLCDALQLSVPRDRGSPADIYLYRHGGEFRFLFLFLSPYFSKVFERKDCVKLNDPPSIKRYPTIIVSSVFHLALCESGVSNK